MRLTTTTREGLRVLHSAMLAEVADTIPAIHTARVRLDGYREQVREMPDFYGVTAGEAEAEAFDAITAAIDAGKGIPRAAFEKVAEAHLRIVSASGVNAAAERIDSSLSQALEDAIAANRDAIYSALNDRLTATVKAGRKARELLGEPSAEAAITAGHPEQWTAYTAARTTFAAVRQAQSQMYRYADDVELGEDKTHRVAAAIANPVELFPEVGAFLWGVPVERRGKFYAPTLPWPDPWRESGEHFDWITATPNARAWVPTSEQQQAAYAELSEAAQAHSIGPRPARGRSASSRLGIEVAEV